MILYRSTSFLDRNGRVPWNRNPSPAGAPGGGSATLNQMILGRQLGFFVHAVSLNAERSSPTAVTGSTS
jgi:hypothetical protein